MSNLIKLADAVGKTIARVTDLDEPYAAIFYTDGTHSCLRACYGYDDPFIEDGTPEEYEQMQLGIISKEEYDRIEQAKNALRAAEYEQHQRREYEKLKAKFEAKP